MEAARFLLVAVGGLIIDLSVAWSAAQMLGLPLWLAAVLGFVVAATLNYMLHELWTFRDGARRLSATRALRYAAGLVLTLAARIAAVAVLAAIVGREHALIVLVTGAAVSFVVNFLISRYLVFRPIVHPRGWHAVTGEGEQEHTNPDDSRWSGPVFDAATFAERQWDHALVIPVINEGERIRRQLVRLQQASLPVDVVVADGGSTDGSLSGDFVSEAGVRAVLTKNGPGRLSAQLRMAYAWCLREGYSGIVTMDGNGKDGVEAIRDMVAKLEEGCDYVQGSRYLPGGLAENTPLERTIANRLIHAPLLSIAGRHWFTDTTNGFRAYSARYLMDPRVQPFRDVFQNYELLFYLTVRAGQLGMKVADVPVKRRYPKGERTPTKILGIGGRIDVLVQTWRAATGRYSPKKPT